MKSFKTTLLMLVFLISTISIALSMSPAHATVSNYAITDITQTAPDTIVVTARCRFCSACNPNHPGSPNRGDGCIPFACGYPPPSFPSYAVCQRGSPDGRFAAVRISGSFGSKTQKLVCDQSNWPLNTLWSHNFIFSGLSFEHGETITVEADFYCSYCYHWYAIPQEFTPNPYTLVFIPLNWQGSISSFETHAETHANYAINEVSKLTSSNTEIVKVTNRLELTFDENDPDHFGDAEWNAIIKHAQDNDATGDVYIALVDENLWGGVAGMARSIYGNVIVVDSDGLGSTETTAHELGHCWGALDEYNYIPWTNERTTVRSGYGFNTYPTSDDPNMPYPPPDYDDVRCPGRSFDGEHCIMGPAGHWYLRRVELGPIEFDLPVYFGGTKGFCPECNSAIDSNIDKVWGASGKGLAKIIMTFFKNGTEPKIEHIEGVPIAGKSMYFGGDGNYSIKAYDETGGLFYKSNVTYSFLTNLPSKTVNCTVTPMEVNSTTIPWFAPAFAQNKITIEIVDNIAGQVIATEEIAIAPAQAWIDYKITDKDNYDFGETIEVTVEVNTTKTSMNVIVDATLFDPDSIARDYKSWTGTIYPAPDPLIFHLTIPSSGEEGTWKVYVVVLNSTGQFQDSEMNLIAVGPVDTIPPTTILTIGLPQYTDSGGNLYVTSDTSFSLSATDDLGGSGVASIGYRIYSTTYDSGWLVNSTSFYLIGLIDGNYFVYYNSTDNAGNVEAINIIALILDNTGPLITVSNPSAGSALQDGVTFMGSIVDSGSGVFSMSFSIREANGGIGIPIGFENLPTSYNSSTGGWSFSFDTLLVPDGYYILYIEAEDNLGNEADATIPYSVRNWAVIELLPSSEDTKAGRTMPVKFALRVAAEVDPDQPFVHNEELRIEIFATADPDNVLQESYYGDTSRDYRISSVLYIVNFKTIKRIPMEYTVAIYRDTFDVGSFTFETVK